MDFELLNEERMEMIGNVIPTKDEIEQFINYNCDYSLMAPPDVLFKDICNIPEV